MCTKYVNKNKILQSLRELRDKCQIVSAMDETIYKALGRNFIVKNVKILGFINFIGQRQSQIQNQ